VLLLLLLFPLAGPYPVLLLLLVLPLAGLAYCPKKKKEKCHRKVPLVDVFPAPSYYMQVTTC